MPNPAPFLHRIPGSNRMGHSFGLLWPMIAIIGLGWMLLAWASSPTPSDPMDQSRMTVQSGGTDGPYLPRDDGMILERLPALVRDATPSLTRWRAELAKDPHNVRAATALAKAYLTIGGAEADPRYDGYAQAVLQPWWKPSSPPTDILLVRAMLHQRRHRFDQALNDLQLLLDRNPRHGQAWLTQAVIFQVIGRYDEARRSCLQALRFSSKLTAFACLANLAALNGQAQEAYHRLHAALAADPTAPASIRLWALTLLAEIAARGNHPAKAEQHFIEALALQQRDVYLLSAYADFLLDQDRPSEVVRLLEHDTRPDALLLRLTLAEQRTGSPEFDRHRHLLHNRIRENRFRNDRRHLREEARFVLQVLDHPEEALALARENWTIQKEPWDARILLEAAVATRDRESAQPVLAWLEATGFDDPRFARLKKRLGTS